jgi:hypothetical protein
MPAEPPRHLVTLARAARRGRLVRLGYRDGAGDTTWREVAVLGLSWRRRAWLFAAHCQLRGALRVFRLDRVLEARLTRRPSPPLAAGFDARAFALVDLLGVGARGRHVAARLEPPLAELAPVLFPGALRTWRREVCCAHLRVADPARFEDLVASLGGRAAVS